MFIARSSALGERSRSHPSRGVDNVKRAPTHRKVRDKWGTRLCLGRSIVSRFAQTAETRKSHDDKDALYRGSPRETTS